MKKYFILIITTILTCNIAAEHIVCEKEITVPFKIGKFSLPKSGLFTKKAITRKIVHSQEEATILTNDGFTCTNLSKPKYNVPQQPRLLFVGETGTCPPGWHRVPNKREYCTPGIAYNSTQNINSTN